MEQPDDITAITDIGVDDALALVLLDRLAGDRRKVITSTFGNTTSEITENNAREFAAYMQNGWLFHQGTQLPLNGRSGTFSAEDYHGSDGLWGVRPPVASLPLKIVDRMPTAQVISLGPLTQLCDLLTSEKPKQITLMGGYFRDEAGTPIRPQANIRMDIDAAEQFFNSCNGVKVRVVPHNVTRNIYWTRETIGSIPETSTVNLWLKRLMITWFDNCPYERFALHDPVATLLAFQPDNASWIESGIKVMRGDSEGITELSQDSPACEIARHIAEPEEVADYIFSSIFIN